MNRLDRHVGSVQRRLMLDRFFDALAYALAAFFAAVLLSVLIDRFLWVDLPRGFVWLCVGAATAVVASIFFAVTHRPSSHEAATLIDQKLELNEKFSTALYARAQSTGRDAFATAAVQDAERTAENVSLYRQFPLVFPNSAYIALIALAVMLLTAYFLPRFDLFDRAEKLALAKQKLAETQAQHQAAEKVLAAVSSLPTAIQGKQNVELAKQDLKRVLDQQSPDPTVVKLTAQKAKEEAEIAKQEEIKKNQSFAQALTDKAVFNSLNPSPDEHGPVADASKDIANGDFAKAVEALQKLPQQFNEMTPEQQKKATEQMQNIAQQLQKIAQDPAAMQHLQQQLQQQGATPQQMQQMAKAVQQAAQGNPQAQQQLQQMQKQLTQQMNGGKGPTQQQAAQIQKTMQQMQQVANSQMKAQQMTQGAQQMAMGMKMSQTGRPTMGQQGTRASLNQAGSQQNSNSQNASQKPGQQGTAQQAAGQQPGGQQQGGQQPGSQQAGGKQAGGQQPGGQQDGQQQMQQAGQQMAQAAGEMDAVQKDAEQVAAAQNGGGDQPGDGSGPGEGQKPGGGGQAPGKNGKPAGGKGNGMGGPGIGNGGVGEKQLAQYTVKQEIDPSQNIANGKVLAKTYVKADQLIGKSTIELSPAAKAAVKESTDDVSEETVPKDAQKVVKDYFDTVGNGQ